MTVQLMKQHLSNVMHLVEIL